MTQARFWIFDNGAVRLKLNAGDSFRHVTGGPTDEGYSYTESFYSFDGKTVIRNYRTQASDCDGRIDRHGVVICALANLSAGYVDAESGVTFPEWRHVKRGQRDYSAEAAGY